MPSTMLAIVKPSPAPGAEIRDVKIPAFGRNDVLVKVKVASICGTDLHIYNWDRWAQNRIHPPLIPAPTCISTTGTAGRRTAFIRR